MQNFIFVKGSEIYEAAVEGAKRGYNRSTDDLNVYAKALNKEYELLINNSTTDIKKRKRIRNNTYNNWRNAVMPLMFLLYHDHIMLQPSERHVRVMLIESNTIFDIPLNKWEELKARSK